MNIYLVLVALGLLIKLAASYRLFFDFPNHYRHIKPELMVFIVVFLGYSVVQMLLFGPSAWAEFFGLSRIYVLRVYYFSDGLSLIVGGYLLVSMFDVKVHRHPALVIGLVCFIAIGAHFVIYTPLIVDGLRPGPANLQFTIPGESVGWGRAMVYLSTAAILIALYRSYQIARSNNAQIKNVYALVAALIYDISCLIGTYKVFPLLMAVRGIIFYVVVVTILQRNRFFDIRPAAPVTLEANTLREFNKTFRDYASEDCGHREALRRIERSLVAYKLEKITGFKESKGSSLPEVAASMNISLSSLYDILKRTDLSKPEKSVRDEAKRKKHS